MAGVGKQSEYANQKTSKERCDKYKQREKESGQKIRQSARRKNGWGDVQWLSLGSQRWGAS